MGCSRHSRPAPLIGAVQTAAFPAKACEASAHSTPYTCEIKCAICWQCRNIGGRAGERRPAAYPSNSVDVMRDNKSKTRDFCFKLHCKFCRCSKSSRQSSIERTRNIRPKMDMGRSSRAGQMDAKAAPSVARKGKTMRQ